MEQSEAANGAEARILQAKLEKVTETLSVYQQAGVFSYGTDAVLLAAYAADAGLAARKKDVSGIELCSGTAFAALALLDRFPTLTMTALEINDAACRLSERSAAASGISSRFCAVCGDIRKVRHIFPSERYDFAVCNPPYMTPDCGKRCADPAQDAARHEVYCRIGDVFAAARFLLGTGGRLYLVYRPDRLSALFAGARAHDFEIKRMTFVYSKADRPPILVLCEAKKQAREGLRIGEPFLIYRDDGTLTEKMQRISANGGGVFGK